MNDYNMLTKKYWTRFVATSLINIGVFVAYRLYIHYDKKKSNDDKAALNHKIDNLNQLLQKHKERKADLLAEEKISHKLREDNSLDKEKSKTMNLAMKTSIQGEKNLDQVSNDKLASNYPSEIDTKKEIKVRKNRVNKGLSKLDKEKLPSEQSKHQNLIKEKRKAGRPKNKVNVQ